MVHKTSLDVKAWLRYLLMCVILIGCAGVRRECFCLQERMSPCFSSVRDLITGGGTLGSLFLKRTRKGLFLCSRFKITVTLLTFVCLTISEVSILGRDNRCLANCGQGGGC